MKSASFLLAALALSLGCSAGEDKTDTPARDSGGDVTLDVTTDSSTLDLGTDTDPGDGGCASKAYVAAQAPASVLVVLDRSQSMGAGGKWSSAGLAIVSAIDQDTFDTMSVGLLASPSANVEGPACLFKFPVACGNPALPQVAVKPAGKDKSTGSVGPRAEIYKWLSANAPFGSLDATPLYEAIKSGYASLKLSAAKAKRILVVITDGTISCTSLSTRKGFKDGNGCFDWEDPQNLVDLAKAAHDDPTDPVLTFVIGVPGTDAAPDTSGASAPPYWVLRALSAMAKVGAPAFVDPTCDGAVTGGKPAKACHFDMSSGSLDAKALAGNIAKIRGAALGCTYELPVPTDGSTVDKTKVNVRIETPSGNTDLKKRSDATDTCAADDCWDYDAAGKIELIGRSCATAKALTDGKVNIVVGCKTVVK